MNLKHLKKKVPLMMAGASIVGVGLTFISALKAGEELQKRKEDWDENTTTGEKVATYVEVVSGPAALATGTAVCIAVSVTKLEGEVDKLTGTCLLFEQTLRQYEQKVVDVAGEETAEKIRQEIDVDNILEQGAYEHPCDSDEDEDDDLELFYDEMSKRKFYDREVNVLKAIIALNREFEHRLEIEQNRFYEILGNPDLQPTEEGAQKGWSKYIGEITYGYYMIDFRIEEVEIEDGPYPGTCKIVHPIVAPHMDYDFY